MSARNALLHALIAEFRESENVFERTLGEILLRQANHLDGEALVERLGEVTTGLSAALETFSLEAEQTGK